MKELKCPKCGSVFSVDEADYASILSQVKNHEFEAEIKRRMAEMDSIHRAEQQVANAKAEQNLQNLLSRKALELNAKDAEMARLKSEKEAEIAHLKNQLENITPKSETSRTSGVRSRSESKGSRNASQVF